MCKAKAILLFSLSMMTTACVEPKNFSSSDGCPSEKYYSADFLQSAFYQGWRILQRGENRHKCFVALPYFIQELQDNSHVELASLYVDYCTLPATNNAIEKSSIYNGQHMAHQIEEDEFKWMLNLALCENVVEQFAFGKMLYDGFITTQDKEQGLYFLTQAAKKNHIAAQQTLVKALEQEGEQDIAEQWRERMRKARAEYYK